jgi:PAS domain S-box-containing protein
MISSFITRPRDRPDAMKILILLTLFIVFAANLYGLTAGVSIVLPHLFYIPIILAAFFYPRRGVAFAIVLSAAYFLMVALVQPGNSQDTISAAARCVVFVVIAAVVSYLSERVSVREAELIQAKEEWERTFDAVPDLVALIDTEHRILRVNRAMAAGTGISPERAVGMKCFEVIHHSKTPHAGCPHAALLKDGREHAAEIHDDVLGGDFFITTSPLHDAGGNLIGSVHIARDITEQKTMEEALKAALKKLNMLSSITRHDILNQVTALRTYLELSREKLKGTPVAAFIENEDHAAEAIQRQIEFTRYYQDIGVNAPKWQDVETIIREAASQLALAGIDLQVAIGKTGIFADPLIVKVFFNLMENSLRHGGSVTQMSFSCQETDAGLVITYRDNGAGISTEDKKKLFQKGFGKHTGLGLFLSREILAITGITITENGEPGKGVLFEITVPEGAFRFSA